MHVKEIKTSNMSDKFCRTTTNYTGIYHQSVADGAGAPARFSKFLLVVVVTLFAMYKHVKPY